MKIGRYLLIIFCFSNFYCIPGVKAAVNIQEYFPLDFGNSWTYEAEGYGITQTSTVLSELTLIAGQYTKTLQHSQGIASYYTNDDNGLKFYRRIGEFEDVNFTVNYSPPIGRVSAVTNVGDTESQTGTVSMDVTGYGTFTFSYSASSTVEAQETVSVPAGNFETIRIRWTTRMWGSVAGEYLNETVIETNWFAKEIGLIKQVQDDGFDTITSVLVSTNVIPSYLLTVSKLGTGAGTVASLPSGINCGGDCSEFFDSGTEVTLTAAAENGSTFVEWSGCDSVTGEECTVIMSADSSVTVSFSEIKPSLIPILQLLLLE